jgi:hypothetical protein
MIHTNTNTNVDRVVGELLRGFDANSRGPLHELTDRCASREMRRCLDLVSTSLVELAESEGAPGEVVEGLIDSVMQALLEVRVWGFAAGVAVGWQMAATGLEGPREDDDVMQRAAMLAAGARDTVTAW